MRFWDTSAVVPLCVSEPASQRISRILKEDESMVVWWASRVECVSALARRVREGSLAATAIRQSMIILDSLADTWSEVEPVPAVRSAAERLLRVHPIRAADALQLAAALLWAGSSPRDHVIVCLDQILRDAAAREGFTLLPTETGRASLPRLR